MAGRNGGISDKEKTAFTTPFGLYQLTVMPFGRVNAPATFPKLMEKLLHGLQWANCLIYLDDVIVFSSSMEEHIRRLEDVFLHIHQAGLKLHPPKKCSFARSRVRYQGHIVSSAGIETDPENVTNWPVPTCLAEVRAFLGLTTYYRKFVKNFADIVKPLNQLTVKGNGFYWGLQQDHAFDVLKLKRELSMAPVLAFPRFDVPFTLDTNTSQTGLGAVLTQVIDGEVLLELLQRLKGSTAQLGENY